MGPCFLMDAEEVVATVKWVKLGTEASPTGVVRKMMTASDGFGTRWMTDFR